jgi:hypothetical protein
MVAGLLEQVQLLKRQDMALVRKKELLAESIWSTQLGTLRPVGPGISNSVAPPLGPRGLTATGSWLGDSCLRAGRDSWNGGAH